MANYQPYRSPFGDTTHTKVFVGGLAWETPTEKMRSYFEQFGDILEAVIITDKNTGKSKGYGFVTFRDADSAQRAVVDANPMIDGRRANCNIASLGRQRASPPRGRNDQGGGGGGGGSSSSYRHTGLPTPPMQALQQQPPTTPILYPPYGYTYTPGYGYHHHGLYNPQQLHQAQQFYAAATAAATAAQIYGTSSSSLPMAGNIPYHYGYSLPTSRGAFPSPSAVSPAHRVLSPSAYFYYPSANTATTTASSAAATTATTASSSSAAVGNRSGALLMDQQALFNPYATPYPPSQLQLSPSRDQASSAINTPARLGTGDSQRLAPPQCISSSTETPDAAVVVVTPSETQNA